MKSKAKITAKDFSKFSGRFGRVLAALLRRSAEMPCSFPTDRELVPAADQVFQELDRREATGSERNIA